MLTQYLEGRETVLGRRWWLHSDPHIAAMRLIDQLGRREAHRFAAHLLAELEEVTP